MKTILMAATAVLSLTASVEASAAYTITYQQVGSNVVSTGSGSLLTASGSAGFTGSFYGYVSASRPELYVGSGDYIIRNFSSVNGPSTLGAGTQVTADVNTGVFAGYFYTGDVLSILTSASYVSGTDLGTSTSTYNNRTIASLGLNTGTYVYNFGQGANADSLTIQVGGLSAAVPETSTWLMMIAGFGGIGFAMRRKKVTTRIRFAS
ncbi:PEPxxWA-CTERM sorting domain-containing protein [Sphingomonas sp. RS2018]